MMDTNLQSWESEQIVAKSFRKAIDLFVKEAQVPECRRAEGPGEPFTEALSNLLRFGHQSVLGFDVYGIEGNFKVVSIDYSNKSINLKPVEDME